MSAHFTCRAAHGRLRKQPGPPPQRSRPRLWSKSRQPGTRSSSGSRSWVTMAEQRTILIVEDSRSLAQTCKLQLEAVGHRMLMAETGTAALALLRANTVD